MSDFDITNNSESINIGDTYMAPEMVEEVSSSSSTYFSQKNGEESSSDTYFSNNETNIDSNAPDKIIQDQDVFVIPNDKRINDYVIIDTLSSQGREATVYRVVRSGSEYVMKIYNRKVNYDSSRLELLKNITCPYVVKIEDYGYYEGRLYEISKYYEKGTLSNYKNIDSSKLKVYINQLNEGLHALHNLSETSTLIHGDIKPDNIFISDDEESVLIGDFGISIMLDGASESFSSICGTPEYAPPSYGLIDKARKTPAYDYGSLGLLVFYMATGYSYFANRTTAEIAEGWSKGITLPDSMENRVKLLLKGLLVMDEKKRFGYKEVHDWFEGSYVRIAQPKKLFKEIDVKSNRTLWFGIFDDQIIEVSTIRELTDQMKIHWTQACNKLTDANFYAFLESFEDVARLIPDIKSFVELSDIDVAVFKTIYTLNSDADIVYKGESFGDAECFVSVFSNSDESEQKINIAKEIVLKGMFSFYLKKMGYPADIINSVEKIINLKECSNDVKFHIISFLFSKNKSYNGMENFEQLRARVANMNLFEIENLIKDEAFIAWIYSIGLNDLAISMIRTGGKNIE